MNVIADLKVQIARSCKQRIVFAVFLGLSFCGPHYALCDAADHLARFTEAGRLYEQGRYAEAVQLYASIREAGQANAALYYNLGNALYRTQRIGGAVLNYERALRLAPRDADVRGNLSFVRRMVREPAAPFPASLLQAVNGSVSLNELTLLCSFFLLLAAACGAGFLLGRRRAFLFAGTVSLALCVIFSGWLFLKVSHEVRTRWAVVIAGPADVRNGPGAENSVGFTLPEGRRVIVLGENGDWAAVGLPVEGLKGWVEKKNIEAI